MAAAGGAAASDGGSGSSVGKHDDDDLDDADLDDLDVGDAGGGAGGEETQDDALPATEETANAILPDLTALAGTVFTEPAGGSSEGACDEYPELCVTVQARNQVDFLSTEEDEAVTFQLLAHDSTADAEATLAGGEGTLGADDAFDDADLAAVGDDGASYASREQQAYGGYVTLIQRGPYVGIVSHFGDDSGLQGTALTESLNAMFDARMTQAAAGQQPTATVN